MRKNRKTLLALAIATMTLILWADKPGDIDGLQQAADYQQKAIYHFIQAMKNVKKQLVQAKSEQEQNLNKERNPFEDQQDFKMPEMPPKNNPQVKLQKIIDLQNQVIEDFKKPQSAAERVTKQEEIGDATANLKDEHQLEESVKKALGQALKTSHETAYLMAADSPELAKIKAQKTLSDLKDAMRKLEKVSNQKFNQNLEDAQKKVNDLTSKNQDQKGDDGDKDNNSNQTEKELKALRDKLSEKAEEHHKTGKQKNAEQLAELAKKINDKIDEQETEDEKDKKTLDETLRELQKLIAQLRLQNKKDSQILADSIEKLEECSKELKFLTKHPKSMTANEQAELLRDLEMKMFDMMLALDTLAEDGKNNTNSKSPNEAMAELKNANKEAQKQIDELKKLQARQNASGFSHDPLIYPEKFSQLNDSLHKILINATLLFKNMKTEDLIYIFNPDDIPEKYRDDVAQYFERLSNPEPAETKGKE